jgi:hypothetical protein
MQQFVKLIYQWNYLYQTSNTWFCRTPQVVCNFPRWSSCLSNEKITCHIWRMKLKPIFHQWSVRALTRICIITVVIIPLSTKLTLIYSQRCVSYVYTSMSTCEGTHVNYYTVRSARMRSHNDKNKLVPKCGVSKRQAHNRRRVHSVGAGWMKSVCILLRAVRAFDRFFTRTQGVQ